MTELDALLILNALPGLSNKRVYALIQHFGSARNVLVQDIDDWGVRDKVKTLIARFDQEAFLKEEYRLMRQADAEVITYFDPCYPIRLKEIPDAPLVLYVKGPLPTGDQAISIVGSRRASLYGLDQARMFARALADKNISVISGLARGIDIAAHKGALEADGVTVAVLGSGLSRVYPAEHQAYIERICRKGAVVSEFSMAAEPFAYNFPRRNRIVSGLSRGLLVVEAAVKSGALITADFALEQGRDVYCIPGSVDSPASRGVHHLIQQGGKLVTCVDDILQDLTIQESDATVPELSDPGQNVSCTDEERLILNLLGREPVHIDALGVDAASILLRLELKNLVKELPGKHYVVQK